MLPSQHWARNFSVTEADIDYLNTVLLEREVPLRSQTLANTLIEERILQEKQALQDRFKDAVPYNPAEGYQTGQRLVFPAMDFATGTVQETRAGDNPDYGEFDVIKVAFDDPSEEREFAANLQMDHALSHENGVTLAESGEQITLQDVIDSEYYEDIIYAVDVGLESSGELINVGGFWFPFGLMLEVNEGHMHLAEAVLDMNGGGPMTTESMLQEIGGLGSGKTELQAFSINYALNEDPRFDEVGPSGEIVWYLERMEPEHVQDTPEMLRYTPISYDRETLSTTMLELEMELGDELSPLEAPNVHLDEARVTLIYPHRRLGTLPLNYAAQHVVPTARKTPRVGITLIDGQDGEEYSAWVVRKNRYIYGLTAMYTKHALPIGASVILRRTEQQGRVIIDFDSYKARSEWVTLVNAVDGNIGFETAKRAIGATYDDLLLLGVDDLEGVGALFQGGNPQPLAAILRNIIPQLGKLTAQGHVHAKTLYSAVNVIRRCPPGPILATLHNNPDFENVGGHYWKLSL